MYMDVSTISSPGAKNILSQIRISYSKIRLIRSFLIIHECMRQLYLQRTKELFRSNEARSKFVVSDGFVQRPNYTHHHVFVQSKGIGHRPLFPDTCILYDVSCIISDIDAAM